MVDISVILPIYRVEKYITKCIESILNQTYKNYEIIIIDDGSNDSSIDICKFALKKQENVNYKVIVKENGGQSSARNLGLEESNGEFVVFIDSDDVIGKNFLNDLFTNINDADICMCSYKFVKEQIYAGLNPKYPYKRYNKDEILKAFLKREIKFVVPSMMFRKSFLIDNNIMFDETIKFSEDQLFIWKCLFEASGINYSASELYGYYIRPNSIMTGSRYKSINEAIDIYFEHTNSFILNYPKYRSITKLIYPRWCLGTLFTCSKNMKYEEFELIYKKVNGKKIILSMIELGELKSILLSIIMAVSPKLGYEICRRTK